MRTPPDEIVAKLKGAAAGIASSFDRIRVDDIVAASGVPTSTLYYYFDGKDGVLGFLLRNALDELGDASAKAITGTGTAAARLGDLVRAQLEYVRDHPALSVLLFANLARAGALPEVGARIDRGFHAPVRTLLDEGVADGSLRATPDPSVAATVFFGSIAAVSLHSLVLHQSIDVDELIAAVGPIFAGGIVA